MEGLTPDDVGGDREHELTEYARALVPALPFDEIDVLIVERGGKDISGTTLDPNVTGRFWVEGLDEPKTPRVSTIVLLDLTDVSEGNALGIGFADFIPASLANSSTSRRPTSTASPPAQPDSAAAGCRWCSATRKRASRRRCTMCGRGPDEPKRVVRIRSTLHLTHCWVSDALRP